MNKELSLLDIARTMTRFQAEIADMLEAKATEAEKVRNWVTLHMLPHDTQLCEDRMKQALDVHDLMIEVINGVSKMQVSLGQHLKLLIGHDRADDLMDGLDGTAGSDVSGDVGGLGMFGGTSEK